MNAFLRTSTLAVVLLVSGGALAQPKPAVVHIVDEAQRTPLVVTLPLSNEHNCTTTPAQCQTPAPTGKRFVIESVGAYLQIDKLGGSGDPRGGLVVSLPAGTTFFPMVMVTSNSEQDNWAFHTPFRGYVDAGERVSCATNGFNSIGTILVDGECALTGYLIDKP